MKKLKAFSYCKDADCAYINVVGRKDKIARTKVLQDKGGLVVADYNEAGELIGIELVFVKELLKENAE